MPTAVKYKSDLDTPCQVLDMDAEYLNIGSADDDTRFTAFPPALRLLTTVISANHKGFVTVDAGLNSLYKDGGTPEVVVPEDSALVYGWFGDFIYLNQKGVLYAGLGFDRTR